MGGSCIAMATVRGHRGTRGVLHQHARLFHQPAHCVPSHGIALRLEVFRHPPTAVAVSRSGSNGLDPWHQRAVVRIDFGDSLALLVSVKSTATHF
jgi:hypothetical protein